MVTPAKAKQQATHVVSALGRAYPDAACALEFSNALELLVAAVLSAQCTDKRVNEVTKVLFGKYRSAADYARAPVAVLENEIRSTGFFRNKARNIQDFCQRIAQQYGGEVPRNMDALVELPGVGRKTASVVLGTAYGIASGVVVDTHVIRLSRRLGLTAHKDPEKIERDLMEQIPRKEWINFSHRMIQHGRRVCTARKPKCDECPLGDFCPRIGLSDT